MFFVYSLSVLLKSCFPDHRYKDIMGKLVSSIGIELKKKEEENLYVTL